MAAENMPAPRGPDESTPLRAVSRLWAGERLDWLKEPDGTLWVSAASAAALLGYKNARSFLSVADTPKVAAEIAEYVRTASVLTPGGVQRARVFREAALLIVAQHMQGARGVETRRRLAEAEEDRSKRARRASDHIGGVAGQAVQIIDDTVAALAPLEDQLPCRSESREAIEDVRRLLEEHRTTVEVAGRGRNAAGRLLAAVDIDDQVRARIERQREGLT